METKEKLHWLTVILFMTTGILHILRSLFMEEYLQAIGMMIAGIIYSSLSILLTLLKENKIIAFLSIICPIIGPTIGILVVILTGMIMPIFIFALFILFIIIDAIIVPIRIYLYLQMSK